MKISSTASVSRDQPGSLAPATRRANIPSAIAMNRDSLVKQSATQMPIAKATSPDRQARPAWQKPAAFAGGGIVGVGVATLFVVRSIGLTSPLLANGGLTALAVGFGILAVSAVCTYFSGYSDQPDGPRPSPLDNAITGIYAGGVVFGGLMVAGEFMIGSLMTGPPGPFMAAQSLTGFAIALGTMCVGALLAKKS